MLLGLLPVQAGVKMPASFGDHLVLRQGATLPVWGRAEPGEETTVTREACASGQPVFVPGVLLPLIQLHRFNVAVKAGDVNGSEEKFAGQHVQGFGSRSG